MRRKVEEAEKEIERLKGEIRGVDETAKRAIAEEWVAFVSCDEGAGGRVESGEMKGASPDSWRKELESKDEIIADMELEISRLRGQLSS